MSVHRARVLWERKSQEPFTYESYARDHRIFFGAEDGAPLLASAAPEYRGNARLPNPEEELVAALSSCHMLTFLAIAARRGHRVEHYEDHAEGTLAKNGEGRLAVTVCVLRPHVKFGKDVAIETAALRKMHEEAHRGCFISASVKTEVRVELR